MADREQFIVAEGIEGSAQEPDRVSTVLRYGIVFVIVTILCVVIYALMVGAFMPPAPRTLVESSLIQAQAAVQKSPGSGQAWASLAGAHYAAGNKAEAWKTLERGRLSVKDRSILLINVSELDFLIADGKNDEVVKRSDEYIQAEAKAQVEEAAENAKKGIRVPDQFQSNLNGVRLFVLKASALGNLGRWDEAIKTLDTALALDDRAADIFALRGWARLKNGDKPGAIKDFKTTLKFLPGDTSATEGLAAAEATSAK